MKTLLTAAITLFFVLTSLTGCEKSTTDVLTQPDRSAKTAAPNFVTETRIIPAPYTYGWVWNKSTTAAATVTCYYNMTLSATSGWVLATTKTVNARQDFTYCKLGVKQIKMLVNYDKNAGSYEFLSGQTYSCR
ncbi:hypothetical protein [uncultured Fibrella sp.]|uniref:hypothetical protein n=1 Tax=uncultured Fibrella sp. TaxID=1284596 RepID=UPI0035CB9B77